MVSAASSRAVCRTGSKARSAIDTSSSCSAASPGSATSPEFILGTVLGSPDMVLGASRSERRGFEPRPPH